MNIIFFNTGALGDYLIQSSIINELKKKNNCKLIAVCSVYNSKIISNEEHIDEVILYDKNWNFLQKINTLKKILKQNYLISFVADAQLFSYFANYLLKSKYKRGIITKKIKKIFYNFTFYKPYKFLANIIFDKYIIQTRPKYLKQIEHLPTKFINLFNDFNIQNKNIYFFNQKKKQNLKKNILLKKINFSKYICIHLDWKWNDIQNIECKLNENLKKLALKTKYKIIIFSYKNNCSYYKNLEKNNNIINPKNLSVNIKNKDKNIFILKDCDLFLEERIISSSSWNISCHAGILVHSAAANQKKIIDILPENQLLIQTCWVPSTNYFQVLKQTNDKKFDINKIFNNLIKIIIK